MSDAAKTAPDLPEDTDALKAIIGDFKTAVGALEATIGIQKLEIERLQEQLRLARHKRFGASSEKTPVDQLGLFNEAEVASTAPDNDGSGAETEITVPEHKRAKGGRKKLPEHLPRVRIEHDIPDEDKLCPCGSGEKRKKIGEVVSEQIDIVPAQAQVLQNVRFQYGDCGCCHGVFDDGSLEDGALDDGEPPPQCEARNGNDAGTPKTPETSQPASPPRAIIVAPLPVQPIPKSIASPGTCAFVTAAKYVDGLPLYRQVPILSRHGLDISRSTLAFWMIRLGDLIIPLINLMDEIQAGYDILQIDETTVQVLKEDGRAAQTKSRMWVRRGGPPGQHVILFTYEPTRSGKVAWRLTEEFKGYLQSDGYIGYDAVGKRKDIVHVGCLAHARRKFDEAVKAQAKTGRGGLAKQGLALINKIYRIEKLAREAGLKAEARKKLRDEKARPIWKELREWLDKVRHHAPPKTLVGMALRYLDEQWPHLVAVLEDGRLEVDNNLCENAIRPFCLGRKNWMFSDTPAGAEASARLYSLVETAKANGLEPYAYLRRVFTDLPQAKTLEDVEALLPWNIAPTATQSVAA